MFETIWRGWLRDRTNARLFDAVTVTLDRMCQGGIYDHLGGGFARYATDTEWLIPHFEKMLYDNAQLIDLLTLVWQETRSPLYAARIAETCDWVLREMVAAKGGGFAATYDADSEGVEGKFYVWDEAEIDADPGRRCGLLQAGLRRHARRATGSTTPSCTAIAGRSSWATPRSNGWRACAPG